MERRDIIKDEIERLGQVLGIILAKLLGTKPKLDQPREYLQEQFREQLDIDFGALSKMDDQESIDYLLDKELTYDHIDQVAQILETLADREGSKELLQKAHFLLQYVHDKDNTFSFEREARISTLMDKLSKI